MKSKINLFIILLSLTAMFISCDRPDCKNTNPLFDNYSPDSREYKTELIKQLKNKDKLKLSYWFNEYVVSNGQELLLFNIQGDGLCAIIVLTVEQWDKLKELRQKKGVSFRGAEFKNLKFDIQQDFTNVNFILRDFDRIID
jgi:hypothetical protein